MAVSVMAAIPVLKETYTQLKARMDKGVHAFQAELAEDVPRAHEIGARGRRLDLPTE